MSDTAASDPSRNLLFGLLAFQNNFIDRCALLSAFDAWTADKARPLGRVLAAQGAISDDLLNLINGLVAAHLSKHDNEPEKSLAALTPIGSVLEDLEALADSEAKASLSQVSIAPSNYDPFATNFESVGDPTSAGTRFRILRPLNKGGMGVVSVALDTELDRSIALKEIRDTAANDAGYRARFLAEAEITGKLEHPGIIPIYGLGTYADGRPFYAMRLIRGDKTGSLMDAIERFYKEPNPSSRVVEFRGLLRRFLDVCNAVSYAHSKGVLHRDLKPDNILLGPYGETLVVDWGLAKAAGKADPVTLTDGEQVRLNLSGSELSPTMAGGAMGTPEYAPPEQMIGDLANIGPRSDVYGLGAILYCLMTGRAPFSRKETDLGKLIKKIEAGDFPPLRQVRAEIDKPLEAICLKAMSRKPADRYASARDLAADVENYLADEAVACYRDPLRRRIARFARHHRSTVNAIFMILVALTVTVGIWSWFDRAQREQARLRAENLVTGGEEALSKGRDDDAVKQLSEARTILDSRPDLAELRDRLARSDARAEARTRLAKFLATTADAEEQILTSLWTLLPHEDPDGRRRISRRGAGPSKLELGSLAREALALYSVPDEPATVREPSGLETRTAGQFRIRAGETLFLLALGEERVGQGHRAPQQSAARERACRLLDAAEALGNKTSSLYQYRSKFLGLVGRPNDSAADRRIAERTPLATFLDHHLKAVELSRERKRLPEAATEYRIALAARPGDYWTLYRLGKTLENQGLLSEAEAIYRNILALRPNDPTTHNTLGTILSDQGKNAEAIAEFEEALLADPDYLMAYGNMMKVQGNLKQVDAAQDTLRRFMTRNPDAREQARAWDFIGIAYERAGQDAKALEKFDEAVRLDPEVPGSLRNRALCRSRLGRHAAAVDDIRRAIALKPTDGELHYTKGLLYARWGRDPKVVQDKGERIGRIEEAVAANGEAIRLGHEPARYNHAVMLRQLGRYEEAIVDHDAILQADPTDAFALYERAMNRLHLKNFRIAIDDLDRVLILDTPRARELRVEAYLTRGKAWGDLGSADDLKRSEEDIDRAVELAPNLPDVYRSRGLTRMRRGHASDPAKPETDTEAAICRAAIADYRKYLELRPDASDASSILNDIGSAYLKLGQFDESLAVFGQAIRLRPNPIYYANRANVYMIVSNLQLAVADFDKAVSLDPLHTRAWALRGTARLRQGRFDQATKDLDRALELEPGPYETLILRALANLGGGRADAARRDLDIVARDRPNHARGKFSRGLLNSLDQRYVEATANLSRGMDDPFLRPFGLPYRARAFLKLGTQGASTAAADAEELAELRPLDSVSLLEAVRIWAEAFAADPTLDEGREAEHRYNAACAVALAGSSRDKDDLKPDDATKLRAQAIVWLKAELSGWKKVATTVGPGNKELVARTLKPWKEDADLAGVREEKPLSLLPETERKEWQALWADVDSLLAKVAKP